MMRQAGRILPEYRALREKFPDFKAFVKTPEAATEATLQPVELLGVDAAILFSDILVIPEAMGLNYEMVEKTGPIFPKSIETAADIHALLSAETAADNLEYVYEAMRQTRRALNNRVPLIGFAGAPWTIFAYMVEGRGSKTFSKAKKLLYTQPALSHLLLQKITDTTIIYLQKQVEAGAQLVQIFDSWAGILSPDQYAEFAAPYIEQICTAVTTAPKTIFAKGAYFALYDFSKMPCHVIGIDWNTRPLTARRLVGDKVLQGNLDPCALYADTKMVRKQTIEMLQFFGQKHIANLGHGVYPDTPLDGVKAFIDTVKEYQHFG
jgi:uroporphyrinogen decarboxylase